MDIRALQSSPPLPTPPVVLSDIGLSFTLWLEFEEWVPEPEHDPADDFCNMKVTISDKRAYALNVWTYRFFERARREQNQEYLLPPDLFVERLDRALLESCVAALIRNNELREEWRTADV